VFEEFQGIEYRRIRIRLRRLGRMLALLRGSWRGSERGQTLEELNNILLMQYELERDVSDVKNAFIREYVYGRLDAMASARRSIAEDIRWDQESGDDRKSEDLQSDPGLL
jgi:hypothetical protein